MPENMNEGRAPMPKVAGLREIANTFNSADAVKSVTSGNTTISVNDKGEAKLIRENDTGAFSIDLTITHAKLEKMDPKMAAAVTKALDAGVGCDAACTEHNVAEAANAIAHTKGAKVVGGDKQR